MPVKIFFCYAHEDEALLNKLKTHLRPLQRQGLIDVWHDSDISAGTEWQQEISKHLNEAQIILLLVSSDFVSSDYAYGIEMVRAIERHERGEARVIPIILRPVYWQKAPFGKLQALPKDANPVTSPSWHDQDEAFLSVTEGIRKAVEELSSRPNQLILPTAGAFQPTNAHPSPNQSPQPPVPVTPSSRSRIRFSRRTIMLGLPGLVVGGGIIAWFVSPYGRSLATPHPTDAIPSLGTTIYTYRGHSLGVNALAWSPDGTRIASASDDKTVQVWNAATGGHVYPYRGHSSQVNTVAWHGARIASGNNDVQLWDAATGSHPFIYPGYARGVGVNPVAVYAVAWSPDGTQIVSGGYDKIVQVWNAADGTRLLDYKGHTAYVFAVAWSPDGTYIASGGHDKTVQVWNATTGQPIFTYYDHSSGVSALAWSPDSERIASGAYDNTVRVWEATTGKNPVIYQRHTDRVYAVAWSDKRIVSAAIDKTAQIWDASSGRPIFTYHGHTGGVYAVAWSPDGTRIASGGQDRIVQVWQAK
jgi:WD40 repeat protein